MATGIMSETDEDVYDLNDGVENHYGWCEDRNGHRLFNRCFNSKYYGNKMCGKMDKIEIETVFNIDLTNKLKEITKNKWEKNKLDNIQLLLDNPCLKVYVEIDIFISHGFLDILFNLDENEENMNESYELNADYYEDNYDLEIMLRRIYNKEQKEKIKCVDEFILRHIEKIRTQDTLHKNTKLNHNCIDNILSFI